MFAERCADRDNECPSTTCSSLACMLKGSVSISSSKMLPAPTISNLPERSRSAPVKSSAPVPEQLALDKCLRDGRTVHRHKSRFMPARERVDQSAQMRLAVPLSPVISTLQSTVRDTPYLAHQLAHLGEMQQNGLLLVNDDPGFPCGTLPTASRARNESDSSAASARRPSSSGSEIAFGRTCLQPSEHFAW